MSDPVKNRVVIIDEDGLKDFQIESVTDFIFLPNQKEIDGTYSETPSQAIIPTLKYKLRGAINVSHTLPVYTKMTEEEIEKEKMDDSRIR